MSTLSPSTTPSLLKVKSSRWDQLWESNDIPVNQNWWWRHNFSRQASIDVSKIRGSRIRERRERKWTCVFQKADPLKKQNPSLFPACYFLFRNLWCGVIWMLTFWGNCDIPSGFGSPGFLQRNHCRNDIGHKEITVQCFGKRGSSIYTILH